MKNYVPTLFGGVVASEECNKYLLQIECRLAINGRLRDSNLDLCNVQRKDKKEGEW